MAGCNFYDSIRALSGNEARENCNLCNTICVIAQEEFGNV